MRDQRGPPKPKRERPALPGTGALENFNGNNPLNKRSGARRQASRYRPLPRLIRAGRNFVAPRRLR
jgi:hypothetical protein